MAQKKGQRERTTFRADPFRFTKEVLGQKRSRTLACPAEVISVTCTLIAGGRMSWPTARN